MAGSLTDAAMSGNLASLAALLTSGCYVDERDQWGATALMWAAFGGHVGIVELLLEHGANPLLDDPRGRNAIAHAALAEFREPKRSTVVRMLREVGVPTTLEAASALRDSGAVEQLAARGADINARDVCGTTPLLWAARYGHFDTVIALARLGADLTAPGVGQALSHAVKLGRIGAVRDLLELGMEPDSRSADFSGLASSASRGDALGVRVVISMDERGVTPLVLAAYNGDADIVEFLLECGADSLQTYDDGENALTAAATSNRPTSDQARIVDMLRARRVPVTLMAAAALGDTAAVERLLCEGADVNAAKPNGATALVRAAEQGRLETVLALIRWGADLTATDEMGPALVHAAQNGYAEVVRVLLESGADPNSPGYGPPIVMASYKGYTDVIRLLLAHGADANRGSYGSTALMEAATYGHVDTVKLLLSSGADPSLRDDGGMTALDYALTGESQALVELLKAYMK